MEFKSFMEALKGKQKKLDKNHNGALDVQDFKIIRKEEVVDEGRGMVLHKRRGNALNSDADKLAKRDKPNDFGNSPILPQGKDLLKVRLKADQGKHTRPNLPEETEQLEEATVKTQKYSWGTMKTVHHGSNFSIPLHPEHHQEIAKLKDQQEHKFKTEDGKHWTAKRSGGDVHFQAANGGNSTTVKHSTMSEEVEDLDEVHRMKTKLNSLDDVSNKSIARQKLSHLRNSGKTRGALIANKMRTLNMGDDVSEGYQSYSGPSHGHAYGHSGFGRREREDDEYHVPDPVRKPQAPTHAPVAPVPDRKYIKGTPENKAHKAANKSINGHPTNTNEEVEQIEERNKQNALMRKNMDASRGARYKLNNPVPDASPEQKTAQAHNKAIGRALRSEAHMTTTKDKSGKLVSFKYEGDWKKSTEKKQGSGKAANLAGQGMQTMAKSQDLARARKNNMMTDEVEHIHELDQKTLKSYINKNIKSGRADDGGKGDTGLYRATNKVAGKLKTGTLDNKVKTLGNTPSNAHKNPYEYDASRSELKNRGVHHFAGRRTRTEELNMEEKDEQEYGYEGDMALNQLATLTRCAEMIKEMLKPDTDMPEWVQSKITLATDYIQTAADYMHSEMNEGKSVDIDKVNVAGDVPHEEKFETFKKTKRVKESFDDEGNLISNKISYKDFITEIKLADLPSRKIQGRSYGADYSDPEGADDYDDKKPIKPAAEKRGRGRPAGAKSGARKITGTSKLINK